MDKFANDVEARNGLTAKWIFNRISIVLEKIIIEIGPYYDINWYPYMILIDNHSKMRLNFVSYFTKIMKTL